MMLLIHVTLFIAHGLDDGLSSDRNLRKAFPTLGTNLDDNYDKVQPSFLQESDHTETHDELEAKLDAIRKNTKAELEKLQSDTAAPSSFVEEGAPDSLSGLDAKLKEMQDDTNEQLKKLNDMGTASSFVEENPSEYAIAQYNALKDKMKQQMAAAKSKPSSLLEEGAPDSFADLDAKLKALEEKTKSELAKLQSDTAAPSSFVEEESMPSVTSAVEEEVRNIVDQMLVPVKADISTNAADLATVTSRVNNMTKEFTAMKENTTMELFWGTPSPEAVYQRTSDVSANVATFLQQAALAYANATGAPINFKIGNAQPSSFVEEGAPDSFADLDAKLKALEEKTKSELAKLQSDTAAPSSFVEEGAPDSFADLDAKLKALQEKTKAELAKLQSDTAAPSSFVEEGAMPGSLVELTAHLAALKQDTDTELQQLSEGKITPSSFVENMKKRTNKLKALHTLAMDMPLDALPSSLEKVSAPSSFVQEDDATSPFAEVNADMKTMEEKLKADAKRAKNMGEPKLKLLSDVLSEQEKEQKDQ
jgi:hypothetical protein